MDHRPYPYGLQKIALLKRIPEIAETDAIMKDQIYLIGIKKVFPSLDNVKTARELFELFRNI